MSILVVGGAGCLGRAMLRRFAKVATITGREKTPFTCLIECPCAVWRVPIQHGSAISVDLAESPEATQSVVVVGEGGSCSQTSVAAADKVAVCCGLAMWYLHLSLSLSPDPRMLNELQVAAALLSCGLDSVETIVCTAGAWAGGSVASEEGLQAVDRSVDIASLPAELLLMAGMPNKLLLLSWAYQRAPVLCLFFVPVFSCRSFSLPTWVGRKYVAGERSVCGHHGSPGDALFGDQWAGGVLWGGRGPGPHSRDGGVRSGQGCDAPTGQVNFVDGTALGVLRPKSREK